MTDEERTAHRIKDLAMEVLRQKGDCAKALPHHRRVFYEDDVVEIDWTFPLDLPLPDGSHPRAHFTTRAKATLEIGGQPCKAVKELVVSQSQTSTIWLNPAAARLAAPVRRHLEALTGNPSHDELWERLKAWDHHEWKPVGQSGL